MIEDPPQQEEKSRSQLKREYRDIKKLGIRLVGYSEKQLLALPLSDETREALLAAKKLTRTALQRQYRYIASLLAEEDLAELRGALGRKA